MLFLIFPVVRFILLSFPLFVLALQDCILVSEKHEKECPIARPKASSDLSLTSSVPYSSLVWISGVLLAPGDSAMHSIPASFTSDFLSLYLCCSDFTAPSLASLTVVCRIQANKNKNAKFKCVSIESCSTSIKSPEVPAWHTYFMATRYKFSPPWLKAWTTKHGNERSKIMQTLSMPEQLSVATPSLEYITRNRSSELCFELFSSLGTILYLHFCCQEWLCCHYQVVIQL